MHVRLFYFSLGSKELAVSLEGKPSAEQTEGRRGKVHNSRGDLVSVDIRVLVWRTEA